MRVFDVEVLEYLEWKGAVILVGGYCLQYLLECVDDVGDDKLVLFSDGVSVLIILLSEDPSVDPLRDRNLLLFKQPK
jgi:hypothetical protein